MAKKKKNRIDIVYSTNPDYNYDYDGEQTEETLAPAEQNLELRFERKGRNGKPVTLISGFVGIDEDLNQMGKALKTKCGVGGSVKNGEIILQGDQRPKVGEWLLKEGYRYKKVGS